MRRWVNIRGQQMRKARIEIIPMIDTIFFLLVFFLFTALSMVRMRAMGVNLPKDSTVQKPPFRAVVTVNKAGDWYVNTEKIAPTELASDLQNMVNTHPDSVIIVNVDDTRNVQTLIDVMDQVNTVHTADGSAAPVMISSVTLDAKGNPVGGGS